MPTSKPTVVLGYGGAGRSVVDALISHDVDIRVFDDRPGEDAKAVAADRGVTLETAGDDFDWTSALADAARFVPSPGVPDSHHSIAAAVAQGVDIISEFDLAAEWDNRPIVAITGTDGKTTVTTMAVDMINASGRSTIGVGNTDVPLVEAIADSQWDVFVVEASSFRLGYSQHFAPLAGTWLNFGPDHLDKHRDLAAYEAAKASIWRNLPENGVAIAHADSPAVMRNLPADRRSETFAASGPVDHRIEDGVLWLGDTALIDASAMWRQLPHDLTNALAAAATARVGGATIDGIRAALTDFAGLPHRVAMVAQAGGVSWYDDSKATTPNAVRAAVEAFDSVVLIAGGENKGLDLRPLRDLHPRLRHVIGLGEAGPDVIEVFDGAAPTSRAESMDVAVATAADIAQPGDVVLLSPACASFDQYNDYKERGKHFAKLAQAQTEGIA